MCKKSILESEVNSREEAFEEGFAAATAAVDDLVSSVITEAYSSNFCRGGIVKMDFEKCLRKQFDM